MSTVDANNLRGQSTLPAPGTLTPETPLETTREPVRRPEVAGAGFGMEAIGGMAVVVIAIIGLAGVVPIYLSAISSIVLGAALLFEGFSLFSRLSRLVNEPGGDRFGGLEPRGGTGAGFLASCAGIVLGVLSLLGIFPAVLLPVSAIVFGAGLILSSGTVARLNSFLVERGFADNNLSRRMADECVSAAAGGQVLVGVAAVVMGIVGVCGVYPVTLSLVAFLVLGAGVLFTGSAVSAKLLSRVQP